MAVANPSPQLQLLTGWLYKRGPTVDFAWKRRWCVLLPSALECYADDACQQKVGAVLLGPRSRAVAFSAAGAPGDCIKHSALRPCGFAVDVDPVSGRHRRLHYFDPGDGTSLQTWTAALAVAANTQAHAARDYIAS
eukprot:gb/GFBE01075877.1/.p1 GENE.gb/GFBE01075877.1/~~gb/GFBE01075877.1/.p1  ORF type:complete len:136 (+),score=14.61 gb/GFBE01075877.1/:1-408(+)